ncbi:MAG: N-acetyltransferase [Ruminococcaceae bacterium]|nr:N-acetyltransferase [Oscillospiraceae bacterium]
MTEIYTPYVEADTASFETVAPDTGEMARRLQKTTEVFPWLVCEQAGQVIGYAYASRLGERAGYDWSAAASVYVAGSSRRTGAGKALYNALFALLTAQGYRALYGVLASPNPASERFHERMGFVRQGLLQHAGYKFGRPMGVAYYAKDLLPVMENPPRPKPITAFSSADIAKIIEYGLL